MFDPETAKLVEEIVQDKRIKVATEVLGDYILAKTWIQHAVVVKLLDELISDRH